MQQLSVPPSTLEDVMLAELPTNTTVMSLQTACGTPSRTVTVNKQVIVLPLPS